MSDQGEKGRDVLQELRRERAYRRGYQARTRKGQGRMWLEPHYPPEDADLALSWLDGWSDKHAEIQAGAMPGELGADQEP